MKSGIMTTTAVIVVFGGIATSCNKEDQHANNPKAGLTIVHTKDGGDDDEDPVIRGRVKKSNNSVVVNASVETMTYGTNVSEGTVYTDSMGEFQKKVDPGIYYFKVLAPGETIPYVTDTVHVSKDVEVIITVE